MIVAVAGRRIDTPGASPPRFPLRNRRLVAQRIASALQRVDADTVVASAACGADLLALAAACKLGMRRRIVLPYNREWFLADSVTDRPGHWATLYQKVCDDASTTDNLVMLQQPRGTEQAFRAATDTILDEALRLAQQESPAHPALTGLIVWEGTPRGRDDMTAYMMERMCKVGAHIVEVLTLESVMNST